jgi:hypothetical protein
VVIAVPPGPGRSTWSIAAATRSPLCLVVCTSTRPASPSTVVLLADQRVASSAAAARGSLPAPGSSSLATSSDCSTTRGPVQRLDLVATAAIARWVSETSRVERTRTVRPVGEVHSPSRRSVPARRSRTALVCERGAVADVERLVVDQQPDDLAVGDVDDRLPDSG